MAQGIAQLLGAIGISVVGVKHIRAYEPSPILNRCYSFDALPSALPDVSCIINTLPHHKATQGLLDTAFFARFAQALFINIGRGQSVNTEDLKLALDTDRIRYCVLDVFDEEPLPAASWLWHHPRVFISPHQAAITDIDDIATSFVTALQAISQKAPNTCFVDRDKSY